MCETNDNLLFAVSGRGAMRWRRFKEAFHVLRQRAEREGVTDVADVAPRYQLLKCVRSLSELGHCNFDFKNPATVYAAPPVLVRLPIGGSIASVLSGARTPEMVQRLKDDAPAFNVHVSIEPARGGVFGLPRVIKLTTTSLRNLGELSKSLGIHFSEEPPAWHTAHFSAHIDDFLSELEWLPATEPDWTENTYDPVKLGFGSFFDASDRLRLTRYEDRGKWGFALWNDGLRSGADLDWARFTIASSRSSQIVAYDSRLCIFAVSVATPLPLPLSRAIGLCSGLPAVRREVMLKTGVVPEQRQCNLYDNVPLAIAELVTDKLGQRLIHTNIGK